MLWYAVNPSMVIMPPHTLHIVLTFSLSGHTGVRFGSRIWKADMSAVSTRLAQRGTRELMGRHWNLESWENLFCDEYQDWEEWVLGLNADATAEDVEICESIDRYRKVLKKAGFLAPAPIVKAFEPSKKKRKHRK